MFVSPAMTHQSRARPVREPGVDSIKSFAAVAPKGRGENPYASPSARAHCPLHGRLTATVCCVRAPV